MKVALGSAAIALLGAGTQEMPAWLAAVLMLFGAGGLWKIITADLDRRLKRATVEHTQVDTEKELDAIRRAVVGEARETMVRLEERTHEAEKQAIELLADVEQLKRALADAERNRIAQHATDQSKIRALSEEIERLHDELGAYLAGKQPDKRRRDEPRP